VARLVGEANVAQNIIAGIVLILVLFWLFNPASQAPQTIGAISGGVVSTVQALQGYSPQSGGQFYGGQRRG
jgi:hypothetical protein